MKLIVNHRGEQKLVVSKPDASVVAKAKPLLELAAVFFKFDQEGKAIVMNLCNKIIAANAEDEEPEPVQKELPFETEE